MAVSIRRQIGELNERDEAAAEVAAAAAAMAATTADSSFTSSPKVNRETSRSRCQFLKCLPFS